MRIYTAAVLTTALVLPTVTAQAQTKPPVAQFWMDVATHSLSIPGMSDADMGMANMFGGGFFGGTKMGGTPGKWLDTALYTRLKPGGTEGAHAIPPALNMGASLPLIPIVASRSESGAAENGMEKPKGKLLFYWGCGDKVRSGQPKVLDFAKANIEEWGRFMQGRFAPDRGAKAVPGRSVWPNERDRQRVPDSASLQGDHAVSGAGVPANLHFGLREAYDFMPKLQMNAEGDPKAAVNVSWQALQAAQGYFLSAMGARGEDEMIIWSSSEQPDPGWGLMDYVAPGQVRKLIDEKVVLPPTTMNCTVPAGIFGSTEGAMVRMVAYGPELNLAHPPRPANAKAPWEPEWAVRVRIKSTSMTMLGMEAEGGRSGSMEKSGGSASPPGLPGLGDVLKGVKGIFGN